MNGSWSQMLVRDVGISGTYQWESRTWDLGVLEGYHPKDGWSIELNNESIEEKHYELDLGIIEDRETNLYLNEHIEAFNITTLMQNIKLDDYSIGYQHLEFK